MPVGVVHAIFEARDAIGGTWDLFRYPGIRSDSDMHTLGYSFRPWDGEKTIADGDFDPAVHQGYGPEATGVDRHIRFKHRVVAANWSSDESVWHITASRGATGRGRLLMTAGFVFGCSGYYRYDHGYLPDFAGMESFEGTLIHPQAWPEDLDVTGKRVVVIGSGATAVTLVPALARSAAHVTMLQRSPTYIASVPEKSPAASLLRAVLPSKAAAAASKWFHTLLTQGFYRLCRRFPNPGAPPADRGDQAAAAQGLRRENAFHADVQAVGPALLCGAERRPVRGAQRRFRHRW